MALQSFYSCPADCDTALNLPALAENQDCTSYDQKDSQLCDLVIVPTTASNPFDFTDPDNPTLVSGEIDNTNTDNTKTKRLVGEGGVAVPEKIVSEYPKNKSRITKRVYTVVFNVKNMSSTQYEFLRAIQCGWTGFTFYYANLGGRLFGPDGGIEPLSVDADLPLSETRDDKEVGTITVTFEAEGDPPRANSPLA